MFLKPEIDVVKIGISGALCEWAGSVGRSVGRPVERANKVMEYDVRGRVMEMLCVPVKLGWFIIVHCTVYSVTETIIK